MSRALPHLIEVPLERSERSGPGTQQRLSSTMAIKDAEEFEDADQAEDAEVIEGNAVIVDALAKP